MAEKFHERFNIEVSADDARRRFVNRAYSAIFEEFVYGLRSDMVSTLRRAVAISLGARYDSRESWDTYVGNDLYKCLLAIETIYKMVPVVGYERKKLERIITGILYITEVDIGVRWEDGRFIPAGAELLDDKLINESLRWLREKGYESVLAPFNKGLDHFLHTVKRPEVAADVVTDMYEAIEALALIVTGKNDLSASYQLFISKVRASEAYKKILKEYIAYANEFRHAAKEGKPKPDISPREAESFMYLTGIFIRLTMSAE